MQTIFHKLKFTPTLLTIMFISACGGSNDASTTPTTPTTPNVINTLNVKPSLGKIRNALVILKNAETGIKIDEKNIEDLGNISFNINADIKNILLEVYATDNTSYFDEATSTDSNDKITYQPIPKGLIFRSAAQIINKDSELAVNVFTDAAVQRAEKLQQEQGGSFMSHFISAKQIIEKSFDIKNILTAPVIIETQQQLTQLNLSKEADLYAFKLAALAQLAHKQLGINDKTPAFTIAKILAADFKDGDIDGSDNTTKLPYNIDTIDDDYRLMTTNLVNNLIQQGENNTLLNYNLSNLQQIKNFILNTPLAINPIPLKTLKLELQRGILEKDSELVYFLPLTVKIVDSEGIALKFKNISITTYPIEYLRGTYIFDETKTPVWQTKAANLNDIAPNNIINPNIFNQPIYCPAEDSGINGTGAFNWQIDVIDGVSEDRNGDGRLTPGDLISLSHKNTTTNDLGLANSTLIYGRSYGNWVVAKVIVAAKLFNQTLNTEQSFLLPVALEDVNDPAVAPPGGLISPFGMPSILQTQSYDGIAYKTTGLYFSSKGVINTSDLAKTTPTITNKSSPTESDHLDPCTQHPDISKTYIFRTE